MPLYIILYRLKKAVSRNRSKHKGCVKIVSSIKLSPKRAVIMSLFAGHPRDQIGKEPVSSYACAKTIFDAISGWLSFGNQERTRFVFDQTCARDVVKLCPYDIVTLGILPSIFVAYLSEIKIFNRLIFLRKTD